MTACVPTPLGHFAGISIPVISASVFATSGQASERWSEDRPDYPKWPDDHERPVRVIDSVGAAFANIAEDGGWRRESWTIVSTPPTDRKLKRELSVSNLTRNK